ncbi:hypothetical protein I3760_16G055800 [Carya illinoinensis]|nr:hypothetical protein I3760_16G055800 [Carya illinoinensis]
MLRNRGHSMWLPYHELGHRPMYSSSNSLLSVDPEFIEKVGPLLLQNKVNLVLFGHVHNYERTCSVYQNKCMAMPKRDGNRIDTYDHSNYSAPLHAVIGMAGFSLDKFPNDVESWSLSRISQFGYFKGHATKKELKLSVCKFRYNES